jgi:hypothetical protein
MFTRDATQTDGGQQREAATASPPPITDTTCSQARETSPRNPRRKSHANGDAANTANVHECQSRATDNSIHVAMSYGTEEPLPTHRGGTSNGKVNQPSDRHGPGTTSAPGPQCAFERSMINVSCNSHYFTQLAAFFIDPRAE